MFDVEGKIGKIREEIDALKESLASTKLDLDDIRIAQGTIAGLRQAIMILQEPEPDGDGS